ncbi:MAG TPA: dihydropteroate synthase [Acidobacteriota bacterium]|nr:dihydropteroate synthase [Acidobacteriota bacterium]HNT16912.1 dihydropteroate synthase [Acidobacteriota bacterium]HQO20698.1 dihydropteroate synthase [Acidobacteriota bacterium]HQQ47489.1 dihydropteroate synthase [Acidobacteriota bacterium]
MRPRATELLKTRHFLVMGILNLTPDSFYDGGRHRSAEAAVRHVYRMKEEGADIIDIGAESTRPGSLPLSSEEEWSRLYPVLTALSRDKFDLAISIDTQKSEIAAMAADLGAVMINDISSGRTDPRIFKVARDKNADLVLMHMKGTPKTMQDSPSYADATAEIRAELSSFSDAAMLAGVEKERIIVDPGIGFGKRKEDNLALIAGLPSIAGLGFPVMVGVSRKSVIGGVTGADPEHRLPGTIALNVCALQGGARIFRVHDVAENRQALQCAWETMENGR